jgi:hypothetical protein
VALVLLLLPSLAGRSPDEVYGRISHVVDGDTFDLEVSQGDDIESQQESLSGSGWQI